ncbi:39S ribosomal protein L12, mitochondrial [Tetranychus urticae]|uniref:Large ribosomal subunit protein bL12m n=1 Tax=Tetranychus urticae TaxID=32264 RepID=T1KE73_TETUR|nr:39S ribosomal protein L12, mitochondrial [Tetranychus urticae]
MSLPPAMFRCIRNVHSSGLYYNFAKSVCYRSYTSEAAAQPEKPLTMPTPGAEKVFDVKLSKIVDEIEKLTLLEVSDLNQLLKKRLNIPDTPMMAMGAMPVAATHASAQDEAEEPKAVKSSYTVKITKFDESKKVGLIKEIKGLVSGLNLVQAKKFVESVPQIIKSDLSKEEAEKLKSHLESLGATVVMD